LQGRIEIGGRTGSMPSILFASIPKSGTVFTGQMLSRGLGLELVRVSMEGFPRDLFDLPRLVEFSQGGKVGTAHFDASPENLQLLGGLIDRWIVHIRDPRSVLLSWIHHLDRLHREGGTGAYQLLKIYPSPPSEYFGKTFAEKADWNIESFLPAAVHWIETWLDVYDSRKYRILLTTYSEIVSNESTYLFKIMDFCEISRDRFVRPELKKTIQDMHFRAGLEDEWRMALTREQLERANSIIGQELLDRFNWPA